MKNLENISKGKKRPKKISNFSSTHRRFHCITEHKLHQRHFPLCVRRCGAPKVRYADARHPLRRFALRLRKQACPEGS